MADDTQVVEVTGPDQKTYHFPTGTTKEQAVAYFKKKGVGIAPPASTKPPSVPKTPAEAASPEASKLWQMSDYKRRALAKRTQYDPSTAAYGFTPSNIATNLGKGVIAAGRTGYDVAKDVVTRFPESMLGKDTTYERFIDRPSEADAAKAAELYKSGRLIEAAGHGVAASIPMLGSIGSQLGEQAGRGDIGGALAQGAGMYLGGKAIADTSELVIDKATQMVDPASLRQRAAELNTKALKTAEAGKKGYNLSVGLQVAQERIVGSMKTLPAKIEAVRMAKDVAVRGAARAADTSGVTLDVSQDLQPVMRDIAAISNRQGTLSPKLINQLRDLQTRVTTQFDMRTGQRVPRNLQSMSVSNALALEKGLEDLSSFGGEKAPTEIQNAARRFRKAINDKLPQNIQKLRAEESKLITARDAARENYTKMLNDKTSVGRGVLYGSAGTIAAYLAMRGMGVMPVAAIGSVVVLRALAASTKSRTLRAALYARAADLMDSSIRANAGPTGATGAGSPQTGPNAPTGPQVPRLQGVTGALPGQGATPQGAPPVAPASVVNPPGLRAAPSPTRSVADVVQPARDTAAYQKYVAQGMSMSEALRAAAKEVNPSKATEGPAWFQEQAKLEKAKGRGTVSMTPEEEARGKTAPKVRAKPEDAWKQAGSGRVVRPRGNVAESNTKTKAMMDRLDELQMRRDNPKSGADRVAIEREIDEIKRMLSGENLGTKHAGAPKRIADRERLAAKRAEAKAATPGASTAPHAGTTAEPASQSASPEVRAFALDAGYKKLATYEDGSSMVGALQKQAKDMQRAGLPYDEVQALTDALNAMKEITGQ